MSQRTLWTQRRVTSIALIVGCVLFQVAAFLPVKDIDTLPAKAGRFSG